MAWYLTQAVGIEAYDAANNRTLYRTRVYLNASGSNSYSGYSTYGGGSVAGQGFSYTGPSAASLSNSAVEVYTGTFWVGSDINGYLGGVSADSWFQGGGGFSPGYLAASASTGGVNYDRKPAAVTGTAATVNADKSVTVTFSGGGSPGGSPALSSTYNLQYSQNGGGFVSAGTGPSPKTVTGLTPGSSYVFRAWATNESNDGAGASSDSASVFIPSGGKRYDGSAYVSTQTAKRYDGSNFVTIITAKRYDGSSWVNLS